MAPVRLASIETRGEAETFALGRRLGEVAVPGTVVCLVGDLGAGKTVFARGVGEGLAVSTRVQSPTYIILQAHAGGRLDLWHADLYRLGDVADVEQLGLDDVLEGDGVVLVEWADRFAEILPSDRLEVRIAIGAGDHRWIELTATGPRHAALALP